MLEKILLAVDGSDHARRAVGAAAELARSGGGTIRVLHVRELAISARVEGDSPAEAQKLVDDTVAELEQAGVGAEGVVRTSTGGSPAGIILEQASEFGAGIIVVGSRGRSDLTALLLGSVAHKIIHLATCPVLVVRHEEDREPRVPLLRQETRFQA